MDSRSYRTDPASAWAIYATVNAEPVDRTAVHDALDAALQALQALNDPAKDEIIFLLEGIAGDLVDATARIDAAVGRGNAALASVLGAVERGDESMRSTFDSGAGTVDPALVARFGSGAR